MDQKTQELLGKAVDGIDSMYGVTNRLTFAVNAQNKILARGLALLVYTQDMGRAPETGQECDQALDLANFILTGGKRTAPSPEPTKTDSISEPRPLRPLAVEGHANKPDPVGEPAAQVKRPVPTKTGLA